MKGNEFSANKLTTNGEEWIKKLIQTLTIKEYGAGTIKSYGNEMTLLFKYFNHKKVEKITQEDIEQYILQRAKSVHKVGRAKCRSVAQACSFFQKVMKINYIVPSNLYPKKQFLPAQYHEQMEVAKLFESGFQLKEYCVVAVVRLRYAHQ
ncbi:MAG: phage integrase N-terminal SAM-like domain-containing protein [Saprospiraceae bacterium]|nr:phage integrase N-terminal SAM-like domain-containing protein [Saprospiraceae bacterium]